MGGAGYIPGKRKEKRQNAAMCGLNSHEIGWQFAVSVRINIELHDSLQNYAKKQIIIQNSSDYGATLADLMYFCWIRSGFAWFHQNPQRIRWKRAKTGADVV